MGGDLWPELARLALRRIWSAPRMSAVLLAGAVLAVGLASAAPIFIEAVRDLGLRQALASVEASELDLRFIQSGVTADAESVADVEELIATEVETAAGELLVGQMGAGRTGGYVLRGDAEEFGADGAAHGTFVWQTDLTEQSELHEGSMPQAGAAGGTIEVAIEQSQAERFGTGSRRRTLGATVLAGQPTRKPNSDRRNRAARQRRAALVDRGRVVLANRGA